MENDMKLVFTEDTLRLKSRYDDRNYEPIDNNKKGHKYRKKLSTDTFFSNKYKKYQIFYITVRMFIAILLIILLMVVIKPFKNTHTNEINKDSNIHIDLKVN